MSSTSSNIDLEEQSGSSSGDESTLVGFISLIVGVLYYAYGLFPMTFHRHSHAAPAASAAEPSWAFVVRAANLVDGRTTPVAVTQEELEGQQTSSVREENGQPVVGIWIVPTVIGVLSCLIQVVEGIRKANSDQKLLLYLCSSMSLVTALLGIMLSILPTMQWINTQRRNFINRLMSAAALGFSFADICVLIFLFIVEESKARD